MLTKRKKKRTNRTPRQTVKAKLHDKITERNTHTHTQKKRKKKKKEDDPVQPNKKISIFKMWFLLKCV